MDIFCDLRAVQVLLQIDSPGEMVPILRHAPNLFEYWMLPVFLFILTLLGYMRVSYTRRLYRLFSSLVRLQIFRQIMREELVFSHRVSILLFVNFALVSGLILYTASKFYGWDLIGYTGWQAFIICFILIAIAYLLKLIVSYFLRVLYRDPGLIREYLFEVILINKALGIILIPIAIALVFVNIAYLNILFIIVAVLAVIFLLFRIFQGIIMSLNYSISSVYIILYLCSLEILPFLVVYKVFVNEIA